MIRLLALVNFSAFLIGICHGEVSAAYETSCASLSVGQYMCGEPEIDTATQQPKGCTKNNTTPGTFVLELDKYNTILNHSISFSLVHYSRQNTMLRNKK